MQAVHRTRNATLVAAVATLLGVPAVNAAEVVVSPGETPTITSGTVATIPVGVSAEGPISCLTNRSSPASAALDTQYSIVGGRAVPSGSPSGALPFYSDGNLSLQQLGSCNVTWETRPVPYRVEVTIAIAPDTGAGEYVLPLTTRLRNTGALGGELEDRDPAAVRVTVADPPPPPVTLPSPRENRSVNLLPVRGRVFVRYPRASTVVRVEQPVQVPVDTKVDVADGFVDLVSDRNGSGAVQAATFSNGRFGVSYSRDLTPGPGRGRRASAPITELSLGRFCPRGARRARRSGRYVPAEIARRRRGLFGRGKGRFRTRGSYGAGTVRGTAWYTESRCDATLFEVTEGVVAVRDFTRRRTIPVRRGQGYLAVPPNRRKGASVG